METTYSGSRRVSDLHYCAACGMRHELIVDAECPYLNGCYEPDEDGTPRAYLPIDGAIPLLWVVACAPITVLLTWGMVELLGVKATAAVLGLGFAATYGLVRRAAP